MKVPCRNACLSAMLLLPFVCAQAQWGNIGERLSTAVSGETHEQLSIHGEFRARVENRAGSLFGQEPDIHTALIRSRLSASWKPSPIVKFSGMVQDARAPWYGANAPSTVRDSADLQEAYVEILPDAKTGFGLTAGRMMLNYGDARLIGSPQWGNLARTYDQARAFYRAGRRARFEVLLLSPVKIRIGEFNRPVLGDRVWGMYNSFADAWRGTGFDIYFLRHDQNRPGGFAGPASTRLNVNTFGVRAAGPVSPRWKYNVEAAVQNGSVASAPHGAAAWVVSMTRNVVVRKRAIDILAEYKFASGGSTPGESGTFDQLYPANHDKFGHEDLFGWRNIHNARILATAKLSRNFAINAMYDNTWLADSRDALYNGSGRAILRSAGGTAGRHVGQEADLFCTYRHGNSQFGAGFGHFFAGEFVRSTSPAVNPVYAYVFHTYTF